MRAKQGRAAKRVGDKTISFKLTGRSETARLNLGDGNYIDILAVETQAMKDAWFKEVFGSRVSAGGDAEVEPGKAVKTRVQQRVSGWNLEFPDGPLTFSKENFQFLPYALIEEIHQFILETDASAKQEAGTDDPNV